MVYDGKIIHLSGAISLFSPFWSIEGSEQEGTAAGVTGHGSKVDTETSLFAQKDQEMVELFVLPQRVRGSSLW